MFSYVLTKKCYTLDPFCSLSQSTGKPMPVAPTLTDKLMTQLTDICKIEQDKLARHLKNYALANILKIELATIANTLNRLNQKSDTESVNLKEKIASKIQEGIGQCSRGFHIRIRQILFFLNEAKNIDQLLYKVRETIINRSARTHCHNLKSKGINTSGGNEVHYFNAVMMAAKNLGLGKFSTLPDPISKQHLKNNESEIYDQLKEAFEKAYNPTGLFHGLVDQLNTPLAQMGYEGDKQKLPSYTYGQYSAFKKYLKALLPTPPNVISLLEQECHIKSGTLAQRLGEDKDSTNILKLIYARLSGKLDHISGILTEDEKKDIRKQVENYSLPPPIKWGLLTKASINYPF